VLAPAVNLFLNSRKQVYPCWHSLLFSSPFFFPGANSAANRQHSVFC